MKFNAQKYFLDGLAKFNPIESNFYHYEINTQAGILRITFYEDKKMPWFACRFDDVQKAKELVRSGVLNKFSGKWNWHCYEKEDQKTFMDEVFKQIELIV
jgi:hypothetical protein